MAMVASDLTSMQTRDGSFECLFAAEYGKVVMIAYRVLADMQEAEDVAQEVFCSFYRLHAPDASYAAAWLHRAAAHTALNAVRGARRRSLREKSEALQRERAQAPASSLDPQQIVEEAERRREVREALGRLSPKSAAVLALRYSGLSYAEVAEALGLGVGQIGTLLRRAEAALRKEMKNATPR